MCNVVVGFPTGSWTMEEDIWTQEPGCCDTCPVEEEGAVGRNHCHCFLLSLSRVSLPATLLMKSRVVVGAVLSVGCFLLPPCFSSCDSAAATAGQLCAEIAAGMNAEDTMERLVELRFATAAAAAQVLATVSAATGRKVSQSRPVKSGQVCRKCVEPVVKSVACGALSHYVPGC